MKIFRIILLGVAMALFAVNFIAIDFNDLYSNQSMWAYLRIGVAFILIVSLLVALRRDFKRKN
jgi:hypothetical protein